MQRADIPCKVQRPGGADAQHLSSAVIYWYGELADLARPRLEGRILQEDESMATRIAINGFGRIGRMFMRAALGRKELEIVAVNDITDAPTLAHLLKHDSIHGALPQKVRAEGGRIFIDDHSFEVLAERDPAKLPWSRLGVQVVVESTGLFTARAKAAAHLDAGAKKVVISAPGESSDVTLCLGVNQDAYDSGRHHVISNASCTTNCLAPVAKVLHENFGIVSGLMTTVHSYTADQNLQDGPHRDLRRARAAALSMIPTSTGAAKAIGLVLPALNGKLDGMAVRVPTPNVSLVDLTAVLERAADAKAINAAMKAAAEGPLKGILEYSEGPLVSADLNHNPHSSIFDAPLTKVIDGKLAKVFSWYDNEWGYSNRLADVTAYVAARL
jgi:glyceraldehyde 3-phosphate dehydrogenase